MRDRSLTIDSYNRARIDRCPIDLYVASAMPYPYSYKLGKPRHASQAVRDSCSYWIMDSGIGDTVTNAEILDLAHEYDASFVVAKDYLHDRERTTQSVTEFLERCADHVCTATPLIPLQPPHHRHVRDLPGHDAYVLGGMAGPKTTPADVVAALHRFRAEVGPDPYVHALGVGGSMTIVRAIGDTPGLVDSVDCSTPERAAINGRVLDAHLCQTNVEIVTGEGSSPGRYALAELNAYQLNDAFTWAARGSTQTTLSEVTAGGGGA